MTLPPLDPEALAGELREYLGDEFDQQRLETHGHEVRHELEQLGGSEERLYRESHAYLYDLTAFAMSGAKEPYLRVLTRLVPPPARLLDYGCGIGSDGLRLMAAGYEVEFADFDNPSTRYLRWRLERRGSQAVVHDVDAGPVPGRFDVAYSFDVIEHVDDPFAFLDRLEAAGDRVLVNFLAPDPWDDAPHRELPVRALMRHAARRRLEHYGRYHHGRSHLVLYGGRPAGPLALVRSVAAVARGRWRAA